MMSGLKAFVRFLFSRKDIEAFTIIPIGVHAPPHTHMHQHIHTTTFAHTHIGMIDFHVETVIR